MTQLQSTSEYQAYLEMGVNKRNKEYLDSLLLIWHRLSLLQPDGSTTLCVWYFPTMQISKAPVNTGLLLHSIQLAKPVLETD